MSNTTAKEKTSKASYSKDQVLDWYETMLVMRKFEEKANQLYMQQKFRGFCHLYIGQEAVSVGIESAITPEDYMITAYRDHGPAISRGVSPDACMAELFGKATGCSKGKGGSMHFFSKEHNFFGGHGIVGGQIPLGTGLGFAIKYLEEEKLCVCMMGDGAVRQGSFHESLNLAMLWELPVIYVIENNQYAMGTSVERSSNVTELYTLAESYDMPAKPINGMDIFTVYEEMKPVVEHVRAGKGPYLVEMKTYRYKGHSMSDPAKYRTREELDEYKSVDPIANIKIYMDENQVASEEELKEIDKRVKKIVADCVKFAEESPYPDTDALYEDVYVSDYPYIME